MHHQGRNKHHFEYWRDYNHEKRIIMPVKMPYRYVAEMFCDRVAASKIHPETSDELELLLRMLEKDGEKRTFAFLKKRIKSNYEY